MRQCLKSVKCKPDPVTAPSPIPEASNHTHYETHGQEGHCARRLSTSSPSTPVPSTCSLCSADQLSHSSSNVPNWFSVSLTLTLSLCSTIPSAWSKFVQMFLPSEQPSLTNLPTAPPHHPLSPHSVLFFSKHLSLLHSTDLFTSHLLR